MEMLRLSKSGRDLHGHVALDGSKSLSNRALIILALSGARSSDRLSRLSTSKDTVTLRRLLEQAGGTYDAGDAGTTFRFMTAYLALQPGEQVLTGSARMRQRPVGALVEALHDLGADIEYLEQPGYPPLRIGELSPGPSAGSSIRVAADVSSQFLSALLMIAPYLPDGLTLIPEGRLVSRPYLEMTLRMMRYFGASADWDGERIVVQPKPYEARSLTIEADWSAASYWYALAAFSPDPQLELEGLFADSWQGDAVLADMMRAFGIRTETLPDASGIRLTRENSVLPEIFEQNFLECPDIAQTLAVVCAGLGARGRLSGLETLAIKETDRTAALQAELAKVGVNFGASGAGNAVYEVSGRAAWDSPPAFATYGDHRMAMAFAPLAMFAPINIEHPSVVAKSYPMFWTHLEQVGFHTEKSDSHVP